MLNRLLLLWLLLPCLTPSAALAQTCPFNDTDLAWRTRLQMLSVAECAGSRKDPSPLVRSALDQYDAGGAIASYDQLAQAVDALAAYAGSQAQSSVATMEWKAMRAALSQDAAVLRQAGNGGARPELNLVWHSLIAQPGSPVTVGGTPVVLVPMLNCTDAPCPSFDTHLDMVRVARLMDTFSTLSEQPAFHEQAERAALELKRWETYRSGGQHQYYWELLANSMRMAEHDCPEARSADGQMRRAGFCNVPTNQIILLHPDAALAWTHNPGKASDLKGAFLVELVGYYRWDWESARSATMTGARGVSLAAIYTDRENGGRWEYGPMFHFGQYNLGISKAKGQRWAITVNIQLAGRYFDAKQKYLNLLQQRP